MTDNHDGGPSWRTWLVGIGAVLSVLLAIGQGREAGGPGFWIGILFLVAAGIYYLESTRIRASRSGRGRWRK